MPRPAFTSKLLLPHRLKYNTANSSTTSVNSIPTSRQGSPKRTMSDVKPGLVLRANVIKGRNLAAKDRSGTSDPYLVVALGDAKQATPTINKTLNPEWNTTLELPVVDEQSLLLEATCWDKDRFGKDYMGDFDVILEDVFQHGYPVAEPQWFPLESRRGGKKKSHVSGEIQIQFTLIDTSNPTATPEQIVQKFFAIAGQTPSPDESDENGLLRADSAGTDLDDDESSSSNEALDESKKAEKHEKRRKKLRMARLRKKAKQISGYEYSDKSEVAGVLFLELSNITDLPPEKNVTRTSFDMDPFVVTSLGKKTYRTKTVRHDLNPVYEEKLVFQVLRHEVHYSVNFTVIDKDKFSGNDYVGMVNFPLEKAVSVAPVADPDTGLYRLPEPSDSPGLPDTGRRSRFRLPVSRSSSSHSLSRLGRPSLKKENSTGSLSAKDSNGSLAPAPTSAPAVDSNGNLAPVPAINVDPSVVDDQDLKTFILPLEMKNKERWEAKHSPTLYIRAKYLPYRALRQQFWRAMLKQYDADESGLIDKIELTTMLDTLGSTLHASTIDSFFSRFMASHNGDELLTFDEAVICLEDQLQKIEQKEAQKSGNVGLFTPGTSTPSLASGQQTPMNKNASRTSIPVLETNQLGSEGEEGDFLADDLTDETGEEHVIEIRECPICHQPKLNKRSDANIITHIATCASQDWKQVNNIVMSGFVTSSQAQRKWYSKVITKISYGGYKLGANSANILVQDRLTGQINEERMSVYVRLGIRMLYKGLKANNMEKKRIRKLLKSLSIKQGKKYDDPASTKEIEPFIAFHQLDMSEVLQPITQFKSFNEFFYRALKPEARPCSAPDDSRVIVSPADCRSVVFNTLDQAQSIWVKGREFTVERLLGDAYPQDAARYHGGSLGIFRLAPQDYHRFHIPVDGVLDEPKIIEGEYYTVNPMAIRSALDVYGENVRVICPIDSVSHGRVMVICIGAMMVGSTVITRNKGDHVKRAEELGYFKFGGSTLLLLFEPGQMRYDDDLVDNSRSALETLVRVGMSIGHSPDRPSHVPDMRKIKPTHQEKQDAKRRIEGSLAPEAWSASCAHARASTLLPRNTDLTFTIPDSMSTVFARSPLTSLPMAANRPSTRRRSAKQAFGDDDALAPKRVKAEVNGASKKTTTTTTKKTTKVAYDENDDGFTFSRRTTRKSTKAQAAPLQESIPEDRVAKLTRRGEVLRSSPEPAPVNTKAPARRKKSIATVESESSETQNRRRSARISSDRNSLEIRPKSIEPLPLKRTGRKAPSEPQKKQKQKQVTPAPEEQPTHAFAGAQTPQHDVSAAKERDPNAKRIMLPFADTPVITRNKEMRKGNKDGHRRSSTGLRGRRASSLIDSGMSNALPHSAIEVADYYKYIEQSLPEPRRMKQLLTWCGSQALPEKPSGDVKNANAIMAARAIQQELIDDFANRPELSDWFSREETAAPPKIKKPNPTNEKNRLTMQELEEEVRRLEEEKAAWESLETSAASFPSVAVPTNDTATTLANIDTSLLDPAQAAILAQLRLPPTLAEEQPPSIAFTFTFTTPFALQSHLNKLSQLLEPNIDLFADGVHKIEQYRNTAERVADRVLGIAAKRLEDRDREVKERVGADDIGVSDVLRGLAGVLREP
ncbi:uncharacterized protein M421DRAFT_97499 [Didymella exigua CBS 183.55]|uniref:Phosphatidylserine decarboxylase proenzyme 2 n=1 Tax=Didymella exigua CBS 183.55 TaxID=1150837 RepID=A0A6A5RZN7_9PLEO|nr:uncharacterized protein M421DRAFT_97499 [Didymella exigua CBS 183.55]KAF1933322.1 hypothetical protein M421DRAFT_97499 [Didymella exigua CBS 183.55]